MIHGLMGGDPQPKKRLTYAQINEWNKYMKANPNKGDLMTLYANYKKQNPNTSIDLNTLQSELDLLLQNSRRFTKDRHGLYSNEVNTGNMFPMMRVMGGEALGPVNGDLRTQGPPPPKNMDASRIKPLPDWVDQLEWDSEWNQPYYKDGDDIVYVDRKHYNSDRFLRPQGLSNGLIAKTK